MSRTNLSMSISADGYIAGPNQSEEHPLGIGGQALHTWHIGPDAEHPVNKQIVSEMLDGMKATIMGRNMFGPVRGEWGTSEWRGWWGDEPPYHCPVFVLTHYPHDPIELKGTTFHFVTDGIVSAYRQATDMPEMAPFRSRAVPHVPARRYRRASSTRSTCRSARRSSDPGSGCSTVSRPAALRWNSSASLRHRASHT